MQSVKSENSPRIRDANKIANRLKRARGQLDAVITAIESGAPCDEVLTLLSAAHAAVRKTAFVVVAGAIRECAINSEDKPKDLERLEKLFLSLS